MITYILHPSYFCEIWALCLSWIIMTTCIYILLCLTYLSKKLIVALSKTSNTVAIICRKTLYPKKCSFKKKKKQKKKQKKILWLSFCGWRSTAYRATAKRKFLPLGLQKFLVLIWSTSKGWKAESTLEPSSGYEPKTPGLWIVYSLYTKLSFQDLILVLHELVEVFFNGGYKDQHGGKKYLTVMWTYYVWTKKSMDLTAMPRNR